jgi:hypothetical protein
VVTGDPVFLRLVGTLHVAVHYAFDAVSPSAPTRARTTVAGTIGARAALQGPGGWSGQLAAVAPVHFSGRTASAIIAVNLSKIAALEKAFTSETGMSLGTTDIVVTPTVHVGGSLAGARVSDSFAPPLTFQMSGQELNLLSSSPGGAPAVFPQLTPELAGSVGLPARAPAHMAILGRSIAVTTARRVGIGGVLAALVATLVGWRWTLRRRRMDQPARIRATLGHDLITVYSSPAGNAGRVVDVGTFDALARLARRYDCMVLELEHADGHAYYVEYGSAVYRCGAEPGPDRARWSIDDPDRPADLTFHVEALRSVS